MQNNFLIKVYRNGLVEKNYQDSLYTIEQKLMEQWGRRKEIEEIMNARKTLASLHSSKTAMEKNSTNNSQNIPLPSKQRKRFATPQEKKDFIKEILLQKNPHIFKQVEELYNQF